ncbi:MAG: hypothetical protein K8S23_00535 [Candidatus Cloacimonetes bacterium]|nr:hypothetical protein [Candidatus Cloacimonadota bacterium]
MKNKIEKISTSYIFVFVLFLSVTLIFNKITNYGQWLPSIMVLIYGLTLLFFQNIGSKTLLNQEKDSPYFMGFILTLVALLHILVFYKEVMDSGNFHFLFEGIGVAISTTIVGLSMRYLIVVTDSSQKTEKKLLQILAEQQEKTILSYTNAQDSLFKLISSFSENHQQIINKEMEYHNNYIENVQKFSKDLSNIYGNLNSDCINKSQSIKESEKNIKNSLMNFVSMIDNCTQKIGDTKNTIADSVGEFAASIKTENVLESMQNLSSSIQSITSNYTRLFDTFKNRIESIDLDNSLKNIVLNIDKINSKTIDTLEKHIELTNGINSDFDKKANERFSSFDNSFDKLIKQTTNFGNILDSTSGNVNIAIKEVIEDLKNGIIKTDMDLKIIDKLLTDFTNVVTKHISKFN